MPYFRFGDDDATVAALAERYRTAAPFPHLVLDDVLCADPSLADAFPDPRWEGWLRYSDEYQRGKRQCSDIDAIPEPFATMIAELNGPRVLRFLERVTATEGLIPDPYLEGGGLHGSIGGGVLAPHTDFHLYRRLGLYRRLNLLLYLNPGWQEGDGGCLELYADPDAKVPVQRIVPAWGRCVVFRTDDRSVHGFPEPVRDGAYRRSLALYYYTSDETDRFSGDTTTYWRSHGRHRGVRRARMATYRALILAARSVAHLAHRANPDWPRR